MLAIRVGCGVRPESISTIAAAAALPYWLARWGGDLFWLLDRGTDVQGRDYERQVDKGQGTEAYVPLHRRRGDYGRKCVVAVGVEHRDALHLRSNRHNSYHRKGMGPYHDYGVTMAIRWNMSKGMEVVMHRDDMGLTIVAPAGAFEMTYEKFVPGSPGTRDPLWQNDEWQTQFHDWI